MMDAAEKHYETFFRKGGEPSWNELSEAKKEDIVQHMPKQANFSGETYSSSHYDEPNILAHMRVNDRTINGKKTLMVEEIQSDWHQEGRKKGYASQKSREENADIQQKMGYLQKDKSQLREEYKQALKTNIEIQDDPRLEELSKKIVDIEKQQMVLAERLNKLGDVPDAPFKKNWHELMVKQALDMAAKGDYDAVAFTTGKQQADRYNLAKHINDLTITRNPTDFVIQATDLNGRPAIHKTVPTLQNLDEYIGKELADKIKDDFANKTGHEHSYSGLDLEVGGEGMKGFYDKMLPDYINKYTKKWGMGMKKGYLEHEEPFSHVKLREEISNMGITPSQFDQLSSAEKKTIMNKARRLGEEVHIVDLSDSAKKDIKQKGQPLFAGIGLAAGSDYMMGPDDQKKTGIFKDLLKHKKD